MYFDNDNKKPKIRYSIKPDAKESTSKGANFYMLLAVATWILGLILAIAITSSNEERITGISDLALFLGFAALFGIMGGVLYGQSELLQNVQEMTDAIRHLNVFIEGAEEEAPVLVNSSQFEAPVRSEAEKEPKMEAPVVIPASGGARANNQGKTCSLIPINTTDGQCELCGLIQRRNRNICFRCGARFQQADNT